MLSKIALTVAALFTTTTCTTHAFTDNHAYHHHTPCSACPSRCNSMLSVLPTDFADASSILISNSAAGVLLNPDIQAEVLSDGSHAFLDLPSLMSGGLGFGKKNKKPFQLSGLKMRYAQVIGRLMMLAIGLLPQHGFPPEEMAVQLLLLGMSMKPIMRSIKLYKCISSSNCAEDCEVKLQNLESAFDLR